MNAIERLNDTEFANVNGGTNVSYFAMDIEIGLTQMTIKANRKLTNLRVFSTDPYAGSRDILTKSSLSAGKKVTCPAPSYGQHYSITCVADGIEQRYEI